MVKSILSREPVYFIEKAVKGIRGTMLKTAMIRDNLMAVFACTVKA